MDDAQEAEGGREGEEELEEKDRLVNHLIAHSSKLQQELKLIRDTLINIGGIDFPDLIQVN